MRLLYKAEFKRNLKTLILWGSIITSLSVLMILLFPAFESSISNLEEMINTLPEAFKNIFGLGSGRLNFSEAYGWYGIEAYLFVVLIGGSYAAILGSSILAKEEDDKTIEFLLSKPISRQKILIAKYLVVLSNLFILNIILLITNIIGFAIIDEVRLLTLILLMVGPFLLQVIFASVALAISVFVVKSRTVMSIALGLVIGLYFLNMIATVTNKLNFLKYFSPYEYVNAVDLIVNNKIKLIYLGLSFLIIVSSLVITWVFYKKKDITV